MIGDAALVIGGLVLLGILFLVFVNWGSQLR